MARDSVLLIDLENLLKGYGFDPHQVQGVLLDLMKQLHGRLAPPRFAVKRVYANWSDSRLMALREEVSQLGLTPVQVLGFSRDARKNAADIQLVMDAMEQALRREDLKCFVIVSGDGGFAALANRLHEYGKEVICAAHQSALSQTLRGTCDEVVVLQEMHRPAASAAHSRPLAGPEVNDPRNRRLLHSQGVDPVMDVAGLQARTRQILDWYGQDPECQKSLQQDGLMLSMVQEGIQAVLPGLNWQRQGFGKFFEYVQYCCGGTPWALVRRQQQPVLVSRAHSDAREWLPELPSRELHSLAHYRSLLALGTPRWVLPEADLQTALWHWLIEHSRQEQALAALTQAASRALQVDEATLKSVLMALVSCGCLVSRLPQLPLLEQPVRLRPDLAHWSQIALEVRQSVQDKLNSLLSPDPVAVMTLDRLCPVPVSD